MSDQEADHDDICQTIRQRALRLGHGMHTCDCPRRRAEAAPPPLDGLREALVDLVEFTEARVKDTCTPLSGCALANAKRLLALRDEGETT